MKERLTPDNALKKLAETGGKRYVSMLQHGTMEIEFYKPDGTDPQQPHTRNEVYIVLSGSGWFVNGTERQRFGPGEVLFVPAGVPHRFEQFSEDFATWAVFYGP